MFDTLTKDEAHQLGQKLAHAGHRFAEVGHILGQVGLASYGTPAYAPIWDQRQRYYDIMEELYTIREELVA
jgi:hypothetical protein